MSYTHFVVEGHLGRDPEMRYTPSGTAVVNFSLAANVGWGDNKRTIWYRVTCWGKTAEFANTYLRKGTHVLIAGDEFEVKSWESEGETRTSNQVELTARTVRLLGRGAEPVGNREEEAPGLLDDPEDYPF